MRSLTYRITTLGCRVNHAESREIESVLRERGLCRAAEGNPADLEVVHTCSVTNTAASKSRHAVRRAIRRFNYHPIPYSGPDQHSPAVLVTGCYAGTDPEQAQGIVQRPGIHGKIIEQHTEDGSMLIDRFRSQLDNWLAAAGRLPSGMPSGRSASLPVREQIPDGSQCGQTSSPSQPTVGRAIRPLPVVEPAVDAGRHVRAELRIQEGCDAHCTFCVIPKIRPTLRSKRIPDAVAEATRLVELGHKEIVLTGIFIGAYGHETALRRRQANRHASPLADLLDAVAHVPGLERLRISSMEPGDVDGPLLDAMLANHPVVVPHLHLPLQSGSDAILKRMNRQYRIGEYLEMIGQVEAALTSPDGLPPAITTDIICGFPGETEADFEQTLAVADRVQYLHMHVFPYSPKRGTAAARWRDRFVDHATVKQRVRTLLERETDPEDGYSIRFRRRMLAKKTRVIVEQADPERPGHMRGRCDHYATLSIPTRHERGTLLQVRVTDVTPEATCGKVVDQPVRLPVVQAHG